MPWFVRVGWPSYDDFCYITTHCVAALIDRSNLHKSTGASSYFHNILYGKHNLIRGTVKLGALLYECAFSVGRVVFSSNLGR